MCLPPIAQYTFSKTKTKWPLAHVLKDKMAAGTCAISKWRRLPLFSAQQGLETWFVIQIGRIVTQPPILKLVIIKAIQSSQTKDFLKESQF
ncbi:hypothetical protein XELAEV_18004072mg [Xenopus laevis]|uniref:Uncharacterized protein n=1 Tax=Xenopus laevis TaxID=8355 RepID=A0A974BPH3_XENLA|nr:hypothetical protein XELAEV_18004072mg [Xenopus laevis]